ncbi:MAG: hypothetical protein C5B49_08275 [Bdellovibrio sp.]|nr:MAG: hypothetical protein C5B49_08275 [Bdellovibrio sp.]
MFVVSSAVIYVYRRKLTQQQEKEVVLKTKTQTWQRFAHLLLGALHLINTPLQSIQIIGHLIRRNDPETAPLVHRLENAISTIRNVLTAFSFADSSVDWKNSNLPTGPDQLKNDVNSILKEFQSAEKSEKV